MAHQLSCILQFAEQCPDLFEKATNITSNYVKLSNIACQRDEFRIFCTCVAFVESAADLITYTIDEQHLRLYFRNLQLFGYVQFSTDGPAFMELIAKHRPVIAQMVYDNLNQKWVMECDSILTATHTGLVQNIDSTSNSTLIKHTSGISFCGQVTLPLMLANGKTYDRIEHDYTFNKMASPVDLLSDSGISYRLYEINTSGVIDIDIFKSYHFCPFIPLDPRDIVKYTIYINPPTHMEHELTYYNRISPNISRVDFNTKVTAAGYMYGNLNGFIGWYKK
jgi:hypothetical protein